MAKSVKAKDTPPRTIAEHKDGELCDWLYEVTTQRQELSRQDALLKEQQTAVEEEILRRLVENKSTTLGSEMALVSLKRSQVPDVEDWNLLWQYINKNRAFDMVQKRTSPEAFRERWATGIKIPGVKVFNKLSLSVSLVRGKRK